jgi:microcystin-dependent protein
MTQPFVGQVQLFGFNFAPRGWQQCTGQVLPISQNPALYSLLGTYYGGNGSSTFGLPNLQGRGAVGAGQGTGLSPYVQGETVGSSTVTLTLTELPSHNHMFLASTSSGSVLTASGNQLGVCKSAGKSGGTTGRVYSPNPNSATTGLAPTAIGMSGGNLPHNNMQPYLTLNYCIAMVGVFPARN